MCVSVCVIYGGTDSANNGGPDEVFLGGANGCIPSLLKKGQTECVCVCPAEFFGSRQRDKKKKVKWCRRGLSSLPGGFRPKTSAERHCYNNTHTHSDRVDGGLRRAAALLWFPSILKSVTKKDGAVSSLLHDEAPPIVS